MIWTYLRACYKFNMRLFVGGVEHIYPARWFFCDPDALIFPSPHGAEASPWLKSFEVNDEWGEVTPYKGLDRGINPGYPGRCFVGDPQWFIDGHVPASIGTWETPVVTPCCGHVPPPSFDLRCPLPPFTCMPFYYPPPHIASDVALTVTTAFETTFVSYDYNLAVAPCLADLGPTIVGGFNTYLVCESVGNPPCWDAPFACSFYLNPFGVLFPQWRLSFVSYDPLTRIGKWLVPSVVPVYGGQVFVFNWNKDPYL